MSPLKEKWSHTVHAGIRMSWFNIIMLILGVLLAINMVRSIYRSDESFQDIYDVTDHYLVSQQTSGMLDTLSASMATECRGFLNDGDPSHVFTFAGQLGALNEQLGVTETRRGTGAKSAADQQLDAALSAFREMNTTEIYVMRMKASTLRVPMETYPPFLQEVELSEEHQALTPEERITAASELLSSDSFEDAKHRMETAINLNHQLIAENSRQQLDISTLVIRDVVHDQKIYVFAFVFLALLALAVNWILVIRPIQKSVRNLDRRERLPVAGSYEVRHLAAAYNTLLEENEKKQKTLSFAATHDPLTGVLNRGAFEEAYPALTQGRNGLAIVDVDHFKYFNDQHGHDVGDRVLIAVSNALKTLSRESDLPCRIGGDEFVLLLKDIDSGKADVIREKTRLVNRELASAKDGLPPVSVSVGVAFTDQLKEGEDLFKCADIALLDVKEHGRADCGVYGEVR